MKKLIFYISIVLFASCVSKKRVIEEENRFQLLSSGGGSFSISSTYVKDSLLDTSNQVWIHQ